MPMETPDEQLLAAAETDDIGRATAAATIARAARAPAVATSPIRFNIQFPPLGLPPLRRRSVHPVCRTRFGGFDSNRFL
jgi:hypothetical protein